MKNKYVRLGLLLLFDVILLVCIFLHVYFNSITCGGSANSPNEDLAELYENHSIFCEEYFAEHNNTSEEFQSFYSIEN